MDRIFVPFGLALWHRAQMIYHNYWEIRFVNVYSQVKERVAQARKAQKIWAKSSFKQRRQFLRILLKYIIEHQELICE